MILNNGDLMDFLVKRAKEYRASGIQESVQYNKHMNETGGTLVDPIEADAVLTDFLNFIGMKAGMDLGLYSTDLQEPSC